VARIVAEVVVPRDSRESVGEVVGAMTAVDRAEGA
jgi:hypothetical protein